MQREKTEMSVQQKQFLKNVHFLWTLHLSFFPPHKSEQPESNSLNYHCLGAPE